MRSQQKRRVYFLGAGASKAFYSSFPIASQLTLDHLLQPEHYDDAVGPRTAIPVLKEFIAHQGEVAALRKHPLETVLGKLRDFGEPYWPYVNCVVCLLRRLKVPATWHEPTLSRWLRRVRERRDVLITTNYDTAIEWTLANEGTGEYSVGSFDAMDRNALHWIDYAIPEDWQFEHRETQTWRTPPERSILYLKLHGSVGWSYCAACDKYSLDPIHSYGAEDAITGWKECKDCKKKKREPVLVAPTENKIYDDKAIKRIWSVAGGALSSASEIVFSGFSLNPFDRPVYELLVEHHKVAKTANVRVVAPDASTLLSRYRAIYDDRVTPFDISWKDYLETETG